jgi:protein-disulfide isomerase
MAALAWGIGFIALVLVLRARGNRNGILYLLIGIAAWVAVLKSGVDPVVVGLLMGLATYASPAARTDLERATDLFRSFREQPTPELARSASIGLTSAISPNERLQQLYHPWTSYVIVPLFALANSGIVLNTEFLARAYTAPVTIGIILGYLVGKPLGTVGCAWLLSKVTHGRVRPSVGWGAVAGTGTVAGIGFTVSLLIASLALHGDVLAEAKLGILSAVVAAAALTWVIFRLVNKLPVRARFRALLGTAEVITDLAVPVDPERDHIRGPEESMVTLVEYGDFECPYCGMAEPVVRELLRDYGEIRYVWRHLPLTDVHPNAQLAAEATEAAARQGAFWEMHDLLLDHQDALHPRDLMGYADSLGLDTDRFAADLRKHAGATHVGEDLESADLSNVSGTPTFFVNGKRHYGAYDIDSLKKAVKLAKARALISACFGPRMWSRSGSTAGIRSWMSRVSPSSSRARRSAGSSCVTRSTPQVSPAATSTADSAPSLASASCSPWNARVAISKATVKPIPAMAPLPATAAAPIGGRIRPWLSRVTAQELTITAIGLPTT